MRQAHSTIYRSDFSTRELFGMRGTTEDKELLLRIAKQEPDLLVGVRLSGIFGRIRAQFTVCSVADNKIHYIMTKGDNPPEEVEHAKDSLKFKSIDNSYQRECLRLFMEEPKKAA